MALRIVKVGRRKQGLFGGIAVDVVALDYDWWHSLAEADGQLEPSEQPMPLGPDGWIYYGRLKDVGKPDEPTWPDTFGHHSPDEAAAALEAKLEMVFRWQ